MRIWKYPLERRDGQIITMPAGSRVLCVHNQFDEPFLWALVDPEAALERRWFLTFGTGHGGVRGQYVGTYIDGQGAYVWHVFDATEGTAPEGDGNA